MNDVVVKLDKQEILELVKDNFSMDEFVEVLSEDKDWLNGILAKGLLSSIKIEKDEIIKACMYEILGDLNLRDLSENIKREVVSKIYNNVSDEVMTKIRSAFKI